MSQSITIKEYDELICGDNITDKQFNLLENFILANSAKDGDGANVLGLAIRNGKKVMTARQYVGTITLADGTNIEILPKIYNKHGGEGKETEVKKIFIDMLRSLHDAPHKNLQNANIETRSKLPLFEIFIRMFLDEVFTIVKTGLKGGYVNVEANENFLKGKLLLGEHIRKNFIHKEKFYIGYDEFDFNQPENRIIKSTLLYLDKRAASARNKQLIKRLLAVFDDVPRSEHYTADFDKIIKERNNSSYETALAWSKIFLTGKTFTVFAGEKYAKALLFDMNDLFECYMAKKVGQYLQKHMQGYSLSVQDSRFYLFHTPKQFALRPDMVITAKNGETYILDTKWKLLSEDKTNAGISQADMYQMYAYFKEYEAHGKNPQSVTLIYPKADEKLESKQYTGNKNVRVNIRFIDLTDMDKSMENLMDIMKC